MNSEKQKSITLGFICLAACLALLFLLHPNLLKQFPVLFEKEGNALLTGMAISTLTSVLVSFLSHYFFQILYMERQRKERDQKAEAELQHEEENFQHLLEHLGDGFFTLDEKLCYTYVNKRICEWSHKEPAEMLGRKIWDVFPNTIGTETYHAVNYAFQHQKYQCSTEFIDKHELWEEYHIYPSSDGLSVFVRDISELKKTEIRLHQKEKQFRSLIENSDDLITLSDKNGRILYISPALEKITGYSLEELKDKSVFQLNHPEHHEEAQRIFSEVLHNPGIPFHTQKRLFHRNGSYIWVEGTVVNLLLDNSVRAVVSNYRDITKSKQTEKSLAESESFYESLFENFNQGFAYCRIIKENDTTTDFEFVRINNTLYSLMNLPEAEGKKASEIFPDHKNYLAFIYEALNEVEKSSKAVKVTYKSPKAERWFEVNIYSPLPGYFCILMEETSLSRKFIEQESLLVSIVNTSKDAIFSRDKNGLITSWNLSAEKLFGYSIEEAIGMSVKKLLPDNLLYELEQAELSIKQGVSVEYIETNRLTKSGTIVMVSMSVSPLINEAGEWIGASIIARDITETKMAESLVKKSETDLRAIFNNSVEAFVLVDKDLTIKAFNSKASKHMLYDFGNAPLKVGTYYLDYAMEQRRAALKEILNRVLAGEYIQYDIDFFATATIPKWFHISFNPVYESDLITGFSVAIKDITQRKQAELKVKKSESDLRAIFENSTEALVLVDKNFKITTFNNNAATNLLLSFGNLPLKAGDDYLNTVMPIRRPALLELLKKVLLGEHIEYDIDFFSKSDNPKWFHISFSPVSENDEISGFCVAIRDITKTRLAELEVRESALNLTTIFENASDGLVLLDRDFIIKEYNNKARYSALLKKSIEGLKKGVCFLDCIDQERQEGARKLFEQVLKGETIENETNFNSTNEKPLWIRGSFSPVFENEAVVGICIGVVDITKDKLADASIKESEENLRTIFENSSESFALLDTNFIIKTFNNKASENVILQKGSQKIKQGISILDCVDTERKENTRQLLQQVLQGKTIDYETDFYSTKEQPHWIRGTFTPVFTQGEVSGLCVAIMDITKDKLAEANIKQSEENLRAIFDNASQGFMLLDVEGKIKSFNQEILNLGISALGTQIQLGLPLYDFVEPNRVEFIKQVLLKVAHGETIEYQHQFAIENQKRVWVEFVMGPVYTDNKVTGICVSGNDITEKVRFEEEKEFDQKNLESLINNTSDMIFSVDKDYRLITFNKAFSDFNEEYRGRPNVKGEYASQGAVSNKIFTAYLPYFNRALEGETFSIVVQNAGHRYGWSEMSFFPIFNNDDVIGTACFIRNITDRMENEQLLIKNSEEKEKLIQMLTLNNKDLQQFAYITSHNLRGPVANLLGLSNLLDNYELKDKTLMQILEGIKISAIRFDETLRDLSTILTIKDNPSVQMEELLFSKALIRAKNQSAPLLKEINAKILTDFSKVDTVFFNRAYFESIITNLLSNAIKYRDKERPLIIKIKTELTENSILFKFSDNGIGLDVDLHKEKLFKLYQRFHSVAEGKGLGLFLIRSQLETLGGSIRVESTINKGTEFILQFKKIPKS